MVCTKSSYGETCPFSFLCRVNANASSNFQIKVDVCCCSNLKLSPGAVYLIRFCALSPFLVDKAPCHIMFTILDRHCLLLVIHWCWTMTLNFGDCFQFFLLQVCLSFLQRTGFSRCFWSNCVSTCAALIR